MNGVESLIKKISHEKLAELLLKAREGDREAFGELYSATISIQYYLALKNTQDESLAFDVVQEVYLKLFNYMEKIKDPKLFVAYLNRINFTVSMNMIEKNKQYILTDFTNENNEVIDPRYDEQAEEQEHEEGKDALAIALNQLDFELKEIVTLRYINNMKVSDIAKFLNMSERSVTRKLSKGIQILKKECWRLRDREFSFAPFLIILSPRILHYIALNVNINKVSSQLYSNLSQRMFSTIGNMNKKNSLQVASKLGKLNKSQKYLRVILMGTSVTIAGTVFTSSLFTNFELRPVQDKEFTNDYLEYEIIPNIQDTIYDISIVNDLNQVTTVYETNQINKVRFTENGHYIIEVSGINGRKIRKEIDIYQIDKEYPKIDTYQYIDGLLIISIMDNTSGINYEKITIKNEQGQQLDFTFTNKQKKRGTIELYTQESITVWIEDNAGNQVEGHINFNWRT
ncbi:MAG: sigma-70 family RNA polymerase sigma factor [Anaerorhabdus sp.]